jgi:hypothetical protein
VETIPVSTEVIVQECRDLQALYAAAATTRRKRDRKVLHDAITRLADDPRRAIRVATVWADLAVAQIRGSFNLADPSAGIYLETEGEVLEGELAAGRFVNLVLREEYDSAHALFEELVRWYDVEDVKTFLGLMVAMSCT